MLVGGCHCGEITFQISSEPVFSSVCHCHDCRRQSGTPIAAWAMAPKDSVSVQGEPHVYASSESGRRSFCRTCGTGLFFTNAALDKMGMIQVRIAALHDPDAVQPKAQVQTAERIVWMARLGDLPAFERFPS